MEVNEVLLEILDQVKRVANEQSAFNARLESVSKITDRQEVDIKELQVVSQDVHRHGVILKGFLWVYGLIISGVLVKLISSKFTG